MRKIHAVLLLFYESKLSQREISRSLEIGYGTVVNYLKRAHKAELTWPLPTGMDDRALELALFPNSTNTDAQHRFTEPDFAVVHVELKSVGMIKQLAWEEYRQTHNNNGYSYSQFCHRYRISIGIEKSTLKTWFCFMNIFMAILVEASVHHIRLVGQVAWRT